LGVSKDYGLTVDVEDQFDLTILDDRELRQRIRLVVEQQLEHSGQWQCELDAMRAELLRRLRHHRASDDDGDGSTGVREPRRPTPSGHAATVRLADNED
jgi:hypothetical protein